MTEPDYGVGVCLYCDPVKREELGQVIDHACPECGAPLFGLLGTESPERFHWAYTLDDDGNPVPADNYATFGKFFMEDRNRIVEQTQIGRAFVSTVFVGFNFAVGGGPPVLWETAVFGLGDEYQERYTSREDAVAGHRRACEMARTMVDRTR